MKILLIVTPFIVLLLWYALKGRAWLKTKPWAQGFFSWIEPIEIMLFKKSETILVGRLLWIGSAIITAHDSVAAFMGGVDWTPVTTRLLAAVPPDLHGITVTMLTGILGLIINWLRKRTTKPLELVAVSQADIEPEVAQAIVAAEVTKQEAVAVVKEAGAA